MRAVCLRYLGFGANVKITWYNLQQEIDFHVETEYNIHIILSVMFFNNR